MGRTAISHERIRRVSQSEAAFSVRGDDKGGKRLIRLDGAEFVRRCRTGGAKLSIPYRDCLSRRFSPARFICHALFLGQRVRRWVNVERPALRKLEQLDWSMVLEDLRVPPGNQLEALKGNRRGQYRIRINDQWRVCFVWTVEGPKNVEIVDYH